MSEEPPAPRRRLPVRWLTLGEAVALAAVVIAGLGYWDSHRERDQEAREKALAAREKQAEQRTAAARRSFILTGQGGGDRLRLAPVNPEQVIQTQALTFPTPVREPEVRTTGNPRIERGWIAHGLMRARPRDAGDEGRLPVGIVTTFLQDGEVRSDRAIYWLGYTIKHRSLRGDELELDGLSLARRGGADDLQVAVDRLWEAER